jgi:hypothetical protein|tara:strand:- start:309 stop:614 length:306 start_codon:yes stop_codon:yes gene_type:complete
LLQLNNGGIASVFGGGGSGGGSILLRTEKGAKGLLAAGAEVYMNYGPRKIDNQLALDHGFTDAFASRPGKFIFVSIWAVRLTSCFVYVYRVRVGTNRDSRI